MKEPPQYATRWDEIQAYHPNLRVLEHHQKNGQTVYALANGKKRITPYLESVCQAEWFAVAQIRDVKTLSPSDLKTLDTFDRYVRLTLELIDQGHTHLEAIRKAYSEIYPPDPERLLWISLPHATGGVILREGRVSETAHIFKHLVGMDEKRLIKWIQFRRGRFQWV